MNNQAKIKITADVAELDRNLFLISQGINDQVSKFVMDLNQKIDTQILSKTTTGALLRFKQQIDAELNFRGITQA